MCLTLGIEYRGMGLIATDTRSTFMRQDGSTYRQDTGGKLWRVPGGWVAVNGSLAIALAGRERLQVTGVADLGAARAEIMEAHRAHAPTIAAMAPWIASYVNDTRFLILQDGATRPSVHEVVTDGSGPRGGLGYCLLQLPPEVELPEHRRQIETVFAQAVQGCRTIMQLVQATASLFASVAPVSESISGDVEIGLSWPGTDGGITTRRLTGGAAELMGSAPAEILARLQSAHAIPAGPLAWGGVACA